MNNFYSQRQTIVRVFSSCILVAVLCSFMSFDADAEVPSPFNKPANQLSRTDVQDVVRLIFDRQVPLDQADMFLARLNPSQLEEFESIFFERLFQPVSSSSMPLSGSLSNPSPRPMDGYGDCLEAGNTQCWKEPIENRPLLQLDGYTNPQSWYVSGTECDDGSDDEFPFYFSIDLQGNPDGAKQAATDTAIALYLRFERINAYGYSYYEVRLCADNTAVYNAGGPGYWLGQMYVGRGN